MAEPAGEKAKVFDIVGGGFAGMAMAWQLQKLGAKVRIFEKSSRLGGLISTLQTPYGIVEKAASGLIGSAEVHALFEDLGLTVYPSHKKYPRRYIFRARPMAMPLRGAEWLRALKLIREKFRGFRGLTPRPEESLRQWSLRHWGEDITDGIVEPAFQGVFASPLENLSATLTLKGLTSPLPKGSGPRGTVAPLKGMGNLIDKWTVRLLKGGAEIHLNTRWQDGRDAHRIILCLSPQEAASYLKHEDSEFSDELSSLERVGLVTMTVFFEEDKNDLRGFGVLNPSGESMSALGVLFNSDIFWERNYEFRSETYIFPERWTDRPDEEILAAALKDRQRIRATESKMLSYFLFRRPKALPLYGFGLERFLNTHSQRCGRFQLFGNSYGNLGLARLLAGAKGLAQKLVVERE